MCDIVFSGGMVITVTGAYLESVREPKMYINLNGGHYYSVC